MNREDFSFASTIDGLEIACYRWATTAPTAWHRPDRARDGRACAALRAFRERALERGLPCLRQRPSRTRPHCAKTRVSRRLRRGRMERAGRRHGHAQRACRQARRWTSNRTARPQHGLVCGPAIYPRSQPAYRRRRALGIGGGRQADVRSVARSRPLVIQPRYRESQDGVRLAEPRPGGRRRVRRGSAMRFRRERARRPVDGGCGAAACRSRHSFGASGRTCRFTSSPAIAIPSITISNG